jgi:hypothetical protein
MSVFHKQIIYTSDYVIKSHYGTNSVQCVLATFPGTYVYNYPQAETVSEFMT